MKRVWVVLIILGILGLAVIGIGGSAFMQAQAAAAKAKEEGEKNYATVETGPIVVNVVETGSLEAEKIVEVKSRVGGRVSQLFVEEGDFVQEGDLIAVIDPQETELQVQQNRAQLKGAQSNVRRIGIEIEQRRLTLRNAIDKARIRIAQLQNELKAQPVISSAAVTSAQTAVTSAQKSYDLLVGVTQPNARIQAQNNVDDAQNNLDKSKLEEDRQKQLYDLGYGTKRTWEQAELQRQLNETRLKQAKDALSRLDNEQSLERERSQEAVNQAKAELSRAKANTIQDDIKIQELQSARADLRNAEAELKSIDVLRENRVGSQASVEQLESVLSDSVRQLGETEIRAPFTGIISKRNVQVGELVSALSTFSTGTPIVTLEDRSSMLVKLQINEIDVARLTQNMAADVTIDAFPNKKFSGSVSKIAPSQIVSAAGTADPVVKYDVEVRLDNVDNELKGGMSAKCSMKAIDLQDVLRLRLDFVGLDEKGRFVEKVLDEKDEKGKPKFERIDIVTGPTAGNFIQIVEGVAEGTKVRKPEYKGPDRRGMMQFGPEEEAEGEGEGGSSSTEGGGGDE